ncbi:MAG TPA: hypothetical protein VMB03_09970 [Bryobacteraceae bacterium]|nr:hypothetical protein [Bryobacteraceae bacterium]
MTRPLVGAISLVLTVVPASPGGEPVKIIPLTVCEALADRLNLNGKTIAIVGRFLGHSYLSDEGVALDADRCPDPVVTEEPSPEANPRRSLTWLNGIALANWQSGGKAMPLDRESLAAKIRAIGRSTELGCYDDVTLNQRSKKWERKRFRYRWAIAYGEFNTKTYLHGPSGFAWAPGYVPSNGFGLMGDFPARIWLTGYAVKIIGELEACPE